MPIYQLHDAQLGDIEGEGYAYAGKTVWGKTYQGVFFGDDDAVEELAEKDKITFKGHVYLRSRERNQEKDVTITNLTRTRNGIRADFECIDNPDETREDEE